MDRLRELDDLGEETPKSSIWCQRYQLESSLE
jgi:hypothetical protein